MNQSRVKHRMATVLAILFLWGSTMPRVSGQESAPESAGVEDLVRNVWVDTPLSQVLRDISMQLHVTIAVDPSVQDCMISLEADGMALDECLRKVAAGQGLVVREIDDRFYLVGSGQPDSPTFIHLADVQRIPLKYITASHLMAILPGDVRQCVSKGDRSTEVLAYAPPDKLARVLEIVHEVDIPRRQVVLEALVVELSKEGGSEFNIEWERIGSRTYFSMENGTEIFTGIAQYTSVPANSLRSLMLTLHMLVRDGKASIRSRPRVATLNGEQATIDVSLEEYFTIVTDIGTFLRTELQVIKSGVMLKMTPQIGDDGDITLKVFTEVGDVASRHNTVSGPNGNSSGNLPVIRRRKAETTVRVKEGDAIVIGGLFETQERYDVRRVPLLGSIPLLGALFRKTVNSTTEKEVVIFIMPRLVETGSPDLAESHNLVDVEKERDSLRSQTTLGSLDKGNMQP